ncbi:MAG: hypothetical protein A3J39_08470 [Sulfuricurvum sp. RIFCSPHIGHO2_12_FULL_44_8]|nr:MAG: hypothetical protein A3J39_08470 [Sulfuricurvum sp. RIFCSPHIGHO2_12_FULL_44_8]
MKTPSPSQKRVKAWAYLYSRGRILQSRNQKRIRLFSSKKYAEQKAKEKDGKIVQLTITYSLTNHL